MDAILYSFHITLSCIAILLHSLGIYLLAVHNRNTSNQAILLINMSATEIVLSTIVILIRLMRVLCISTALEIFDSIELGICVGFYCAMFFIVIERFIGVIFPLKHRVLVTKRHIKIALTFAWSISMITGITGIVLALTGQYKIVVIFKWYFFVLADSALVLAFIVTYGKTLFLITQRMQTIILTGQTNSQRRKNQIFRSHKRFFKVAGLIIFTYIIFMFTPDVILAFFPVGNDVRKHLRTLYYCGYISDPLVYIFLQPELRKMLKDLFCSRICRQRLAYNVSSRAPSAIGRVNDTCM